MPSFGQTSRKRLDTCDVRIQEIMEEVVKIYDITIDCGHRDEATQNRYFDNKKSKVQYPN